MHSYCLALLFLLTFIFVQEANSFQCYENFNPTTDTTPPKGNSKGSKKDCESGINHCIKAAGGGYTARYCDVVVMGNTGLCASLGLNNNCSKQNDCFNSQFAKLFKPQQLDSISCDVCCCDKDSCNFSTGTKAFSAFVIVGIIFSFVITNNLLERKFYVY